MQKDTFQEHCSKGIIEQYEAMAKNIPFFLIYSQVFTRFQPVNFRLPVNNLHL